MILLDTCVISETLRPEPAPHVLTWLDGLPEEGVYIPSLVIGELQKGVDLLPVGGKRSALQVWLEQFRVRFSGRILAIDEQTAVCWGVLTANLDQAGRPLPVVDSLLAAIALRHSALLATRNTRDYQDTGVELINPWVGCRL